MGRQLDRSIHRLENIRLDQFPLSEDPYPGTVPVEQLPVLHELFQFDLGHVHECVDLVLCPLEVLDAEGVDGDVGDARLVTDLQNLGQSLEPQIVPFDRLYHVGFGVPPVPVHHKGHMFRHRPLTQGAYEQFPELVQGPLCGRRRHEPPAKVGHVSGGHYVVVLSRVEGLFGQRGQAERVCPRKGRGPYEEDPRYRERVA